MEPHAAWPSCHPLQVPSVNVPRLAILPGFGPDIMPDAHTLLAISELPAQVTEIVKLMIPQIKDHKRVAVISRPGFTGLFFLGISMLPL